MLDTLMRYKEAAENPEWEAFDKLTRAIHDWRTYVTAEVRAAWFDIPLEGRLAVISCCEQEADAEEWD